MLHLYLFGAPRLERDGEALPLRRSKALALLAYLAATRRPHSREALLALLWPEFEAADARNNLRRELSVLRATIGDEILVADRQQVAWAGHPAAWVDVAAFAEHIAVARAHAHPDGLCATCASALAEAVRLADAQLLAGYGLADSPAFEEWLFFEREELRQQLGWALEALVGWHEARDELQTAAALARRWQALDPLHEPPRRALMRLYARSGQHAAALRQYEEGARLLTSELGAEPEPATTALYEAIRARELAPARRASAISPQTSPPPRSARLPLSAAETGPGDEVGTGAAKDKRPTNGADADTAYPPLTSFIGRRRELGALLERLADPGCRLLSLVGPGGVGKTRLAVEVAAHCRDAFADGAAVVPLGGTTAPAHIPGTVASALGLLLTGSGEAWAELTAVLRDREQLLVLDNFEQLLDAAPRLGELLRAAPRLKLLVTSQEALRIQEEWLWPVAGLELPAEDLGSEAAAADAVQLFVARARQRRVDFALAAEQDAVVRICRLVGGMPLAIELAAAWTSALSCDEIAAEIAGGTALLETKLHNVPERHRSVMAVFDQTWARLDPALRQALARLAVFPAGCTREAAAAVAGASLSALTRLAERSLLRREADGRYRLHPLVRQYAERRLRESPAEAEAADAACARYYAQFLRAQFARQIGGEQLAATGAIRAERENIRRSMPAILDQTSGEPLRQVLHTLQDLYFTCGPYQEGVEILEAAAARLRAAAGDRDADIVRAHVHVSLGFFAVRRGDTAGARGHFAASSELFRALAVAPSPGDATDPEIGLGVIALIEGDYRAASAYGERVRARSEANGLTLNLAYGWYLRAEVAQSQGLLAAAHTAARRALAMAHETGAEWLSAYIRNQLGQIAAALGRYDEADRHFGASYAIREAFGDREGMALALLGQGDTAARRGDHRLAAERYAASLALYEQVGDRGGKARALLGLGGAECALGDYSGAWARIQAALGHARALGFHHVVLDGLVRAAEVLLASGQPEEAPALLTIALVHAASRHETSQRAQQLLGQCDDLLPEAAFAAAVARGRSAELEPTVDWLLAT